MRKRKLKKKTEEYRLLYIKKSDISPARFGYTLYISKEHHDRISLIVSGIGQNNITLYEYLDNVLTEHFNRYFEEISYSLSNRRVY
jgi:hypothetical protein